MKKVYRHILIGIGFTIDVIIFGWIMLWSYINIFKTPTVSFTDLLCVALLLFASLAFSFRTASRLRKKPIYDQLSLPEREQVRTEYYDSRTDGEIRHREEQDARERTHKEKEKRDAEEAIRLLYEHMPERVQTKSIILRNELEELGEYLDQDLAGTEDLTAIRAPIPKFSSKESYLLCDMAHNIADAVIDLAIHNHAPKEYVPDRGKIYKIKWQLRKEVEQDAIGHLTDLDRYYYTPATCMWRAEDFKRYALEED
ncbi:MAG: hypothetical protein GQ553_04475 [Nitrosomonadaceae bacterium]|nr:hypothetical protein [Nitrosomonadaceae bacterium]